MVTKRKTLRDEYVKIPAWVEDLETFREWTDSNEFPEIGRIEFYDGEVHVDMTKEQLFSHVYLKTTFAAVLFQLALSLKLGRYFSDGAYLTNWKADLSCKPDGLFVSAACLAEGRIRIIKGVRSGFVEFEGSADMTLEIVSNRSVLKDKVRMRELYWAAGVREYWLVDARDEKLRFDILRWTAKGYVASQKKTGWIRSRVFDQAFRLTRSTGDDGFPEFRLEVK